MILSIFASFFITFMEAQIFKVPYSAIFTDITPLYMWGIYTQHIHLYNCCYYHNCYFLLPLLVLNPSGEI